MGQSLKRHIGKILRDGRFTLQQSSDCDLEDQEQTKALLAQALVRLGVLPEQDYTTPLQKHEEYPENINEALKFAAGERQLLGELLVQSGHITSAQLDHAVNEHHRSGEKIGDVFTRLGLITKKQLQALLDFQYNQGLAGSSPLRLGNLLVATGHITREQLHDALNKQTLTRKKLGEILVEAGYVQPSHVTLGIRLQKMALTAVLAAILSFGLNAECRASTVELEWEPVAHAELSGYKVYYSADATTFEGCIPLDVKNQTTATISGLDPDKTYNFAVTAYNAAGKESPFSSVVTIKELSPPDAAILYPENATSVSGIVSISVSTTDNVGVTKVDFYINNQPVGTVTAPPYVYVWDTTIQAPGVYTLKVQAYDAAGNVGQAISAVINSDQRPSASNLQEAYDRAVADGSRVVRLAAAEIIPANAGSDPEFIANSDAEVVISGGYDAANQSGNGMSVVTGVMKIRSGTVVADGVTIRSTK